MSNTTNDVLWSRKVSSGCKYRSIFYFSWIRFSSLQSDCLAEAEEETVICEFNGALRSCIIGTYGHIGGPTGELFEFPFSRERWKS